LELLRPQAWLDLTFGLLSGWWHFADNWRTNYPLLSGERWCALLKAQGFVEPQVLGPTMAEPVQGLIVARAESLPQSSKRSWLIFGDGGSVGARVADALRHQGQLCWNLTAAPGDAERVLAQAVPAGDALAGVVYAAHEGAETTTAWTEETARDCGVVL